MSRILRRPMFRGGRVDARGTGIASGLGYNNGGRVGFSNGGSGEYTAKNFQDYKDYIKFKQSFQPQLFKTNKIYSDEEVDTMVDKGKFSNRPWWDFTGIADLAMGVSGPSSDFIQGLQYEKTDAGKKDYRNELLKERDELIKKSQEYGMSVPEGAELSVDAQEDNINPELAALQKKYNTLEQLLLDQAAPKKLTEDEELAEIEKNKKIFQKAYGSGVADDASSMLMGLAGKMLKPEATVKSGFGEFFEDEQKRPSERKKYKDAATTAAINAYLTGQKTLAETESFMNRTDYTNRQKIALSDEVQRGYSMNDFVLNRKQGETKSEALEGGARKKVDFGQYKEFEKIKSKDNTEKLIDQEYVGVIFMDEGTREVFTIIIGEDGKPAKQILYGV